MNNMQLWLISSTDSINLNSAADGYYLNPDLDGLTGLPSIRSSNGVNAGYDGGWTSTQLWDSRLITIRGLIVDKDGSQVELKRKALSKLVGQGKKEPLTLKFVTEFGRTYTCTVRTTNCTMALQNIFTRQEYQIQLRADDPLIYDDGGNDVKATLRVTEDNTGFEIPFDIPLDISGGADPVVVDAGEDTNYPLITMYGELHSPTIVNQTTNQQLQLGADLNGLIRDWNETDTATGNSFQITNSTEYDAPILDFKLNGNTEQTTYSGKNLVGLAHSPASSQILNNVTVSSQTDEKLVIVSSNVQYACLRLFYQLPAGTYTASTKGTSSDSYEPRITIYKAGVAIAQGVTPSSPKSFTLTEEATIDFRFFATTSEATVRTVTFYDFQLEKNNQATAYEPYVGGIASPNPDYPQAVNVVTGEQVVKVEGKNLSPISQYLEIVWGASKTDYKDFLNTLQAGTYTFSALFTITERDDTTDDSKYGIYFANSAGLNVLERPQWGAVGVGATASLAKTFTITAAQVGNFTNAYFYGCGGATGNPNSGEADITNIQLELGNQATTYEAFRGTDYEVNLGKNLFDASTATLVNKYANTNGLMAAAPDWLGIDSFFEVQPSTQYTFSAKNQGARFLWNEYTSASEQTFISPRHESTGTFTTGSSTHYIRFSTNNANATDLQIELGSTATTFAPYFTPIELCKIGDYQDYIYKSGDDWYIHKEIGKVVLDGTETWNYENGRFVSNAMTNLPNVGGRQAVYSDYFTSLLSGSADYGIFAYYAGANYQQIYVYDKDYTTANDFKTWLGTHNTTVYYILATPTDTAITESALITQLNAIVQASLPVGLNNVSNISITPNLAGEMVLTYGTGYIETPPDMAVIDCKDRTVSINGVNAFNLLADGSEFIRLEPGENKLYLTSETQSDSGYAEVKFKTGNLSI